MPRFEYSCVEMVMDKSKDANGYEKYLNTSGAVGWRLVETFYTTTALGSPIRMLTFIREVSGPSPAEAKAIIDGQRRLGEQAKPADLSKTLAYASMTFSLFSFICVIIYILSIR